MANNSYFINVEAAIHRNGKWLVGIRSSSENEAPAMLSFVGGTVEYSDPLIDTLDSALMREVEEEIGVRVRVKDFVHDTSFVSKKGNHVLNVVFIAEIEHGEPYISSDEHTEILWLTTEEIVAHPNVTPWLIESIRRAENRLHDAQGQIKVAK